MKKTWENPELNNIGVEATKEGTQPTTDHDMTTYDASGKWWAGGVS